MNKNLSLRKIVGLGKKILLVDSEDQVFGLIEDQRIAWIEYKEFGLD